MKLILTSTAVILISLILTPRANAQLVDVDFSLGSFWGGVSYGELVGLQANGTSAPTDVIIFSGTEDPKYGTPVTFPEALPFDFGAYNPTQSGEFTLVNGQVTAVVGGFQITENTVDQVTLQLDNGLGGGSVGVPDLGNNELTVTGTDSGYNAINTSGFDGVFYSPGTAVPEPSSYALGLLGLGVLAMLKIRRQRAKA